MTQNRGATGDKLGSLGVRLAISRRDKREFPSPACGQKILFGHRATVSAVTTYRITAVCLGNICRSPIAEAVLRDRVAAAGLGEVVLVDSAGTGDWHIGRDADPRTIATLSAHDYDLDHRARQIAADWFADLDLVLAMDSSNYQNLQIMAAEAGIDADIRMIRSFDPVLAHLDEPHPELDVPDPYYGGDDGFVDVLRMIERAADALVVELPARVNR
jgi:protein-tyrosine phosphatase